MALLEDFLKAADLDDLLKIRQRLAPPGPTEIHYIADVLCEWTDGQAISNLLFYPDLIPEPVRISSIDRALKAIDQPYFILAAVVGLQSIDPESILPETRQRWVSTLLKIVRSDAGVISSRASVTVWSWLRDGEAQEFIRSYPVPDETASKNIIAFVLSKFGELALSEYRARLRESGVGYLKRRHFVRRFEEYQQKRNEPGAAFMALPLLSYIPNYGNVQS